MDSLHLCKYKDFVNLLIGTQSEGLLKYRIFDIAIYDVVVTVVVVLLLQQFLNRFGLPFFDVKYAIPFWPFLGGIFILGIVAHRAFCVKTGVDKMLF